MASLRDRVSQLRAPLVNRRETETQWRGRMHQCAAIVSIPAGILLITAAESTLAALSAGIYAVSLFSMYAASALYNRSLSTPNLRPWMRQLDHSMIFVLIAGTYTPICVQVAPKPWGAITIVAIWGAALSGVVVKWKSLHDDTDRGTGWYIVLGWASVLILPAVVPNMSATEVSLLAAGGVLYTLGTLVLYFRKPNPSDALFAYHEVWHTFVVAASMVHYAMHWLIVSNI